MNDTLARVQRAIDFAEGHLGDLTLQLGTIAAAAGFSPWHFHRLFAAMTGETPATYMRKRRLSEACRRLVASDDALVDVALDAGFESQATFTRAFTRHIGTSPGRYRSARTLTPAHAYGALDLAALMARQVRGTMQPRIVRKGAFHIVGLSGRFTAATSSRIPEIWARFAPQLDDVPQRVGAHTIGVCMDATNGGGGEAEFTYVAAVEVARLDAVPVGLLGVTVPANTYAVFTHSGHISRLGDTVRQIWGRWLPESRYRHVAAPDFEWYDERWDPYSGEGEIDIYIPVAAE